MRNHHLVLILGTCLALLLVAGCGSRTTDATMTAPAQGRTAATPEQGAGSGLTHTGSTGPVTLQVSATFYQTNQTITVTLSNQSNQTIYFPDHLTNCTVMLLQRLKVQPVQPLESENEPAGVNPCRLGIATREHALGAGQSLVVNLVAPSNGWLPGLYLVTLSYRPSLIAGTPMTLSSAVFQVGAAVPSEP